jgi:hypothetical protein
MTTVAAASPSESRELHEPPTHWDAVLSPRLAEVLHILNEAFDFGSSEDVQPACDAA